MKRYRFSWNKPFITGLLFGALSLFYFSGSFGLRQVKRYQGIGAEFMPHYLDTKELKARLDANLAELEADPSLLQ